MPTTRTRSTIRRRALDIDWIPCAIQIQILILIASHRPVIQSRRMASRNIVPKKKLSTREQLLETAGQVFSEKGYSGATGKEICERSGANVAAVVYHFGGMEKLYRAVLNEARSRLAPSEALAAAVAQETNPKSKLTVFIGMLASRMV